MRPVSDGSGERGSASGVGQNMPEDWQLASGCDLGEAIDKYR
jgi:hypothetical protein